jgi:hypothetical protein
MVLIDPNELNRQVMVVRNYYVNNIMQKIGGKTWSFLPSGTKNFLVNSEIILNSFKTNPLTIELRVVDDFSFIAFPAVRAYEGFLKQLAISVPFSLEGKKITKDILEEQPDFGIGVIFNERKNPNITNSLKDPKRFKNYPNLMKVTWDLCRCDILHYDFKRPAIRDLKQSEEDIQLIHRSMKAGYEGYIDNPDFTPEDFLKLLKLPMPKLK